MAVDISRSLLDRILADADDDPGREVCGILFGAGGVISDALATENVAADPARYFEIDPGPLLAAHRGARSGGPAIIGHYHSHPSGSTDPSAADAAQARPDASLWLILSNGRAALWRAGGAGLHDRFRREQLVVVEDALQPARAARACIRDTVPAIGKHD